MEFLRKTKECLLALLIILGVGIVYFFFYTPDYTKTAYVRLDTLGINIIAASLVAVIFGIFWHKLESGRRIGERRLQQRLELRNKSLECFEAARSLKIKVVFFKMSNDSEGSGCKDLGVNFEQIKSYFVELQKVYKKLPGDVALIEQVDKLMEFYNGWERYFLLERQEDLEKFKNSVRESAGYLDCLGKALLAYSYSLQLE